MLRHLAHPACRMYVLEGTALLMRRYHLVPGDVLVVAHAASGGGRFVVGGRRGERRKANRRAGSRVRAACCVHACQGGRSTWERVPSCAEECAGQ